MTGRAGETRGNGGASVIPAITFTDPVTDQGRVGRVPRTRNASAQKSPFPIPFANKKLLHIHNNYIRVNNTEPSSDDALVPLQGGRTVRARRAGDARAQPRDAAAVFQKTLRTSGNVRHGGLSRSWQRVSSSPWPAIFLIPPQWEREERLLMSHSDPRFQPRRQSRGRGGRLRLGELAPFSGSTAL
ncbi:hypothetical protein SKAU_G00302050 [Synaphobranchus kaupii]|uniref:Uncharacterized protein n=1 Tax=Synaphobranchus kaupii TaxID=118154 RepID=A0A9Q1EVV0_SYNKA|nr:hypothetical protein SKAU_G00302050 [Synaphobranchus kaupii]